MGKVTADIDDPDYHRNAELQARDAAAQARVEAQIGRERLAQDLADAADEDGMD